MKRHIELSQRIILNFEKFGGSGEPFPTLSQIVLWVILCSSWTLFSLTDKEEIEKKGEHEARGKRASAKRQTSNVLRLRLAKLVVYNLL